MIFLFKKGANNSNQLEYLANHIPTKDSWIQL